MGLHETMNSNGQPKQTDELRITQLLAINSEQAEQIEKLTISLKEQKKEQIENESKLNSQLNSLKSDCDKLNSQNNSLRERLEKAEREATTSALEDRKEIANFHKRIQELETKLETTKEKLNDKRANNDTRVTVLFWVWLVSLGLNLYSVHSKGALFQFYEGLFQNVNFTWTWIWIFLINIPLAMVILIFGWVMWMWLEDKIYYFLGVGLLAVIVWFFLKSF